ncbi:MAG: outer membrane protein assembly factor BamA [Verrucomicrobiota bacterium]
MTARQYRSAAPFAYACLVGLLLIQILTVEGFGQQADGTGVGSAPVIGEVLIDLRGFQTVSEEIIRANIQTRPGLVYSSRMTREDVRNLKEMGYFRNVQVRLDPTEDEGRVRVIFVVEGNPIIRSLRFEGNKKYRAKRLKEEMITDQDRALNEYALERDSTKLIEFYREHGFDQVQVSYEVETEESTGASSVTFFIQEGPRGFIRQLAFEGNQAFSDRELKKAFEKTKIRRIWSWLFGSGVYLPDDYELDVELLKEFYQNHGYVDARVVDTRFERLRNGLRIVTVVEEGRQYQLGQVQIVGNQVFALEDLQAQLKMKPGEIFDVSKVRTDAGAVEDYCGVRGYANARVQIERVPEDDQKTISVIFHLTEGIQQFVREIRIAGNDRTKDKVIRREVLLNPGEVLNSVKVRTSQQRLRNLGYFDQVRMIPQETDAEQYRDLVVEVEEGRTGEFMVGVGASSDEEILGFMELRQNNFDIAKPPTFMGAGQKMRLRAQVGTRRQDYLISFTEPWFLDRRLSLGTDLYRRDYNYVGADYDETRTGAAIRLRWPLPFIDNFTSARVTYRLEDVEIHDVDDDASELIKQEEGRRTASSVTLDLTRDSRDSYRRPTSGNRTVLSGTVMGGALAGDTDLYRPEIETGHYHKLPWMDHVLHLRGRVGSMEPYGDSERVPIFERYFLGGSNNLRGFKYRHASPRDENGDPIGGNSVWFGSVEYLVPVIDQIWLATFYDVGQVNTDSWEWATDNYNAGAGIGLRLFIPPLGSINLDYAWPVSKDDYPEPSTRNFHFNFGYIF